jgi:glycosyltransferase involved in cell wall biosynthesis
MKVSVIIPAHNPDLQHLRQALITALNQSYRPYEIIIIDDASDNPIEYNGKLITVLRSNENVGPAAARNIGIQHSKGDLISFLDADDRWASQKLELSVNEFKKNDSIGMTCGNYCWVVNGNTHNAFYKKDQYIDFTSLSKVNLVASGSVTVKKSVLNDIGCFNENYWVGEDYELWLRISRKYKVKYINDILYFYRRNSKSNSLSLRKDLHSKTFNIKNFV